jgi:predicted cupin superfamily sugar epimerase
MNKPLTADEIIKELNLKPHPEGGWFRETFRDTHAGTVWTRPRCSIGMAGRRSCSKSRTARRVTTIA